MEVSTATCLSSKITRTNIYYSARSNGIMLLSHLYKCLDTRILAFHPKSHLIRAFTNYDIITEFHGMRAELPRFIPPEVLQHHWDMCCLENTASTLVSFPTSLTSISEHPQPPPSVNELPENTDIPELPQTKVMKVTHGNPSEKVPNTETQNTQISSTQAFKISLYQSEGHPPSPTMWPIEKTSLKGTDIAEQVIGGDKMIGEVDTDKFRRGRSREKKRCVATEDSEDDSSEQRQDGVQGTKRQRLR